jgi:hypothetical protein
MLLLPLVPLLLPFCLAVGCCSSSSSLSVPPVETAMLLVLRRVGLRVLREPLLLLLPCSSPKGLPCRLPPLLLLLGAATGLAEGLTLKVAPPTMSFTTAMLFSVSVPVLSLQQGAGQQSTAQHA